MKGGRQRSWNVARKTSLAALVIGAVLAAVLIGYRLTAPEIVVENTGRAPVLEVTVKLPSSRVVFGPILAGDTQTIYHSASQADGVYEHAVSFIEGPSLIGRCGNVTDSEHGKRLHLVIRGPEAAECLESNKFFLGNTLRN